MQRRYIIKFFKGRKYIYSRRIDRRRGIARAYYKFAGPLDWHTKEQSWS